MSTLTKPQARITLGWAKVSGQRIPVEIDIEWDLFLSRLTERAGGTSGASTPELSEEAFDDAGIDDLKATVYAATDSAGQSPVQMAQEIQQLGTELSGALAQLAELTKEVQGLKQGML